MKSTGGKTKSPKVKAKNVKDLESKRAAGVKGARAINYIEPRYPK